MSECLLEMKGINKSFYGVQVLKNAQLNLKAGEVHVLLGENGAGKSTLIKILASAYRKDSGSIFLNGEELHCKTPKEAIDAGISVIYQEFNLNPHTSIYENIMLGKEECFCGVIKKKKCICSASDYIKMIGLDVDPETLVGDLSVAQKQMVEIAKAISCNVKLLVLDEPTATLTDKETEKLFKIINDVKAQGVGIIYISHRMSELFEIGDRCTVMRDGEYIKTVEMAETNVDELTKLMVGRSVSLDRMVNPYVNEQVEVLNVQNLKYKDRVQDASFSLKKGEILGMAGLVGAGRTEIAKCIIGAFKKESGSVIYKDQDISADTIDQTINKGIVYLSEDRKDEGLIQIHSLKANISLPNLGLFGKIQLNDRSIRDKVVEYIKKLQVKTPSENVPAQSLSGGNQQKVVIAKWLLSDAEVYIFDEPTRGIDVGAREEIYEIMLELVKNGASILMISSDLVEIQKMCNRILVIREGMVAAELINEETLTQDKIMKHALAGGVN